MKFYNFNYRDNNINFLYIEKTKHYNIIKGQVIERITESSVVYDIDKFELDFSKEITDPKEINRLNKLVTFR